MKNTFLILAAGLLFSFSAEAQKKKSKTKSKAKIAKIQVPENVNASFQSQYAVAEGNKWSKNYSGYYVANFTNSSSQKQTVEYNAAGQLVKTRIAYDVAALPDNINAAIQAQYAGSTITEAERTEIAGLKPYFKVKLKTAENKKRELFISDEGIITE